VEGALRYSRQDAAALWRHVTTVEDSADLRQQLPGLGLLAFVADGSILPRRRWGQAQTCLFVFLPLCIVVCWVAVGAVPDVEGLQAPLVDPPVRGWYNMIY
jgi:predicted ABC-class ATPase